MIWADLLVINWRLNSRFILIGDIVIRILSNCSSIPIYSCKITSNFKFDNGKCEKLSIYLLRFGNYNQAKLT